MDIKSLKQRYPIGSRIKCISMKDEISVPPNTYGTIKNVDDMGTIHVNWDNGSTLGLIADVDEFELINLPEKDYEVNDVHLEVITPIFRKTELKPEKNIINHAIKVSAYEFVDLINKPYTHRDYISEYVDEMYKDDNNINHCILVYCDEYDNGIVINSEGFSYARYLGMINDVHQLLSTSLYIEPLEHKRFSKIKVLIVEPQIKPYVAIIDNDLKTFQNLVGGLIESVPLSETTSIICNEEGKLIGLPPNRRLDNDILVGRFLIVGNDQSEHFSSISQKDISTFAEHFSKIEDISPLEIQDTIKYDIVF